MVHPIVFIQGVSRLDITATGDFLGLIRRVCSQTTQLAIKMLYSIMKLHVSARSGHRQVSHRLRGFV